MSLSFSILLWDMVSCWTLNTKFEQAPDCPVSISSVLVLKACTTPVFGVGAKQLNSGLCTASHSPAEPPPQQYLGAP